jgi:hypothetical protein
MGDAALRSSFQTFRLGESAGFAASAAIPSLAVESRECHQRISLSVFES